MDTVAMCEVCDKPVADHPEHPQAGAYLAPVNPVDLTFDQWVQSASDRELLQFNARKANDVVNVLQGIHDGLAPMMEKIGPFLAGMGL